MVHTSLLYAAAAILAARPAAAGEPTIMVFLPGLGCPHTYNPVATLAGCSGIARALGIRYVGRRNDFTDNGKPRACFIDAVKRGAATAQSVARVGTNYGATDSFLCTRAKYVQQERAVDSCPADYSPIIRGSRCASASKVLGITYDNARNGNDYPSAAAVCFVQLLNNDGTHSEFSVTSVNSNHYTRAAWICEWDRPITPIPTKRPSASPTTKNPTAAPVKSPTAAPVRTRTRQKRPPATATTAATTTTTTATRNGPLFVRQDRGLDLCPAGFQPIRTTEGCAQASETLGLEHNDWYDGDDEPGELIVCFVSNVDENQVLGNLVFPSTTRVNSAHWDAAAWICEQSQYYVNRAGSGTCPGKTIRIANPGQCRAATAALGVGYNVRRNGRDGTGPAHCLLKRDGIGLSGSVNNDQGAKDSIICRYP